MQMHYAIPTRPDLLELFVQWSTPIAAGGMCFFFMRSVDLVSDLKHLDATLDVMLRALEIKHARYGSITHPDVFLRDFTAFQNAYAQIHSIEEKKKLASMFTSEQRGKQQHVGQVVYLPKKHKHRPNHAIIKQDDLNLSLAQLMKKCLYSTNFTSKSRHRRWRGRTNSTHICGTSRQKCRGQN